MKKFMSLLITGATIVMLFSGCGNIAEKATEGVIEKAIEKEGGGNVDVDIDNGSYKYQGENGEKAQIGGDIKWPDRMPKDVPVFEGKIISAISDENNRSTVTFAVDENDINKSTQKTKDYCEKLKAAGYEKEIETAVGQDYLASYKKDNIAIGVQCTSGLIVINASEIKPLVN